MIRQAAPKPLPRVLVLDDDPAVLRALCLSLKAVFEVTGTTSPSMALEALAGDEPYAAVVCDVNMPEMDGVTFYRTVRARHAELTHRFVFVTGDTGYAGDPFFESKPVLTKPIARAALRAAVEAALVS